MIIAGGNVSNNSFGNSTTIGCPGIKFRGCDKIKKIAIALGAGLLITGIATAATMALPFVASVILITIGSILVIHSLFRLTLVYFSNGNQSNSIQTFVGSGNVIERKIDISQYDIQKIKLSGFGNLEITQGDNNSLAVSADDNIHEILTEQVDGNKLVLSSKPNTCYQTNIPISYKLTLSHPQEVVISGSGEITVKNLNLPYFQCQISGNGKLKVNAGQVETLNVYISGNGTHNSSELIAKKANVKISGNGNATVNVTEELHVRVSGVGNCYYKGTPQITQRVTGVGQVNPL